MRVFIGIDNGVSGSIGIIKSDGMVKFVRVPVKRSLDYTKYEKWVNRVDYRKLKALFKNLVPQETFVLIEKPMVNPKRFNATLSAVRALEVVIVVLEELRLPFSFVGAKEWQRVILPKGVKDLKEASLQVAKRLFPYIGFEGFEDADGLLIAEYCKRVRKEEVEGG